MYIELKTFQKKAIAELRNQFLKLWKTENRQIDLIFKSPTGSGKTIMVAQFLKNLTIDPQFDVDKAYLWITFSEESYEQSKSKLNSYYDSVNELGLLDLNDLNKKKMGKNEVFFINWQKIKSSSKDGRILRRDSEKSEWDKGLFDEFIIRTQKEGRELILIIDEAHRDKDTELAKEIIDLIDPKIILHVTATPKEEPTYSEVTNLKKGFVEVARLDVIKEELIKEKIITQTKEDLAKVSVKEIDQDILLLELAYNKRQELETKYSAEKTTINPLVLIQLPNDDKARKETMDKSKLDLVKDFLREKKVNEKNIAIWLSEKKENLELIEKNNSGILYLIFKQAAATGWDCPRAQILVMFREIKNPVFHTQTVGRILRMPEAKHYNNLDLNYGYLYTNYERNQINLPDNKQGNNKPFIYESKIKEKITPVILNSTYLSRVDYNDLGASYEYTLQKVFNDYFNIVEGFKGENWNKLKEMRLELKTPIINNKMIVDAEIECFDDFIKEIKDKGTDYDNEISTNDIEKTYNLLCYNIISKQEEENKKFAPERSWATLKRALNVWFQNTIEADRDAYYKIIVYDLLKQNSVLYKAISKSFEVHKDVRLKEVKEKEKRKEQFIELSVPLKNAFFTDDYEEKKVSKCGIVPFYLKKSYVGKDNEEKFIDYLESKKSIDWWYKSGNSGRDNFAVKYFDRDDNVFKLFYPDWIIKLKSNKILILDTKKGNTAKSNDTTYKAEALQNWIKEQKQEIIGGIVVNISGIWKLNNKNIYSYKSNIDDVSKNSLKDSGYKSEFNDWIDLDNLLD
jgi:type III restriction enzyme